MKLLIKAPVILFFLLFISFKPANISKAISSPTPSACTFYFKIDNSAGVHTITHAKIEWPNYIGEWFPSIPGGDSQTFSTTFSGTTMMYPVKVTVWWGSSPAIGAKLRLVTSQDNKTIGSFNSSISAKVSTAVVNGTNPNAPTASYCQGVTLSVEEAL